MTPFMMPAHHGSPEGDLIRLRWQRRRLILIGAVALVLGAVCGWRLSLLQGHTALMTDGSRVTVLAITEGTNHVFLEGPFWLRPIRKVLPRRKAVALGLIPHERSSQTPGCTVWVQWSPARTNGPPVFATVADDAGREGEPVVATMQSNPSGPSRDQVLGWSFSNYPRRQDRLHLRFYDHDAGYHIRFVGGMTVPHRVVIPSSAPGSPPPVAVRDGPEEFLLSTLEPGAPRGQPFGGVGGLDMTRSRLVLEVREHGEPSGDWSLRTLEAIGVTGNWFKIDRPKVDLRGGRITTTFPQVLWPEEPDWRIRAEFVRWRNHAAADQINLAPIPFDRTNLPVVLTLGEERHGLTLQSLYLGGLTQLRPFVRGGYRPNSELTLLYTSKVDHVQVSLARAVDERGREIRFGNESWSWPGRYSAAMEVPFDGRSVLLAFVVQRSRVIEFLVRAWPGVASTSSGFPERTGAATQGAP